MKTRPLTIPRLADRLAAVDWIAIGDRLDRDGFASIGPLLDPAECRSIAALYDDGGRFRSRIVMARHGFGQGEYKYFDYPLPEAVATIRTTAYPPLAAVATRWAGRLGDARRYPEAHADFLAECHEAGQRRATPLLLRYGPGDYNCLHQDLYGEHVFPLQIVILLDAPGRDFEGGELVLVESRPRRQSRAEVVPLGQGEAVVFAVHHRPVQGARGPYRASLRHGVSRLRSGRRHTVGIIFHDAA